ncbi:hypothetical protein EIP86_004713, partial [Pleurotus ostreatoroseus]
VYTDLAGDVLIDLVVDDSPAPAARAAPPPPAPRVELPPPVPAIAATRSGPPAARPPVVGVIRAPRARIRHDPRDDDPRDADYAPTGPVRSARRGRTTTQGSLYDKIDAQKKTWRPDAFRRLDSYSDRPEDFVTPSPGWCEPFQSVDPPGFGFIRRNPERDDCRYASVGGAAHSYFSRQQRFVPDDVALTRTWAEHLAPGEVVDYAYQSLCNVVRPRVSLPCLAIEQFDSVTGASSMAKRPPACSWRVPSDARPVSPGRGVAAAPTTSGIIRRQLKGTPMTATRTTTPGVTNKTVVTRPRPMKTTPGPSTAASPRVPKT